MEPFSLDTQPETSVPFNLDAPQDSPPLDPKTTSDRSFRASYGMEIAGKTYEQIYQEIAAGRETQMRQEMASTVDFQRKMQTQKLISGLARKSPLTMNDIQAIEAAKRSADAQSDPYNVVEEEYAKRFMKALTETSFHKDSSLAQLQKDAPKVSEDILVAGNLLRAQQEIINREIEDARAIQKEQSLPGYLLDKGLMLSQIYEEYQLRGLTPGTGKTTGGFLGSNLEAQAQKLLSLPYSEFKTQFPSIMKSLRDKNPDLAIMFGEVVQGQTAGEQLFNNVLTPLTLTGVGTAAKVYKAARNAKEVADAVKSVVKNLETPSKAANQEAVGDISEAGVTQAATKLNSAVKGVVDPIKDTKERMVAGFKEEAQAASSNPGPFRQDFVNKLEETYLANAIEFVGKVSGVAKVERFGTALRVEQLLRGAEQRVLEEYPGLRNQVATFSTPRKDPNTDVYYVDIHLVQQGNKLWNKSEADKFVRQLGLKDATVQQEEFNFKPAKPIPAAPKAVDYPVNPTTKAKFTSVKEVEAHLVTSKAAQAERRARLANPKDIPEGELKTIRAAAIAGNKEVTDLNKFLKSETATAAKAYEAKVAEVKAHNEVQVEQKGLRWSVKITKAFPETADAVRDYLVFTNDSKTPLSTLNGFGGWVGSLRTPDEVLSFEQNFNRKLVTFGMNGLYKAIKAQTKEIEKLKGWRLPFTSKKQKWEQWERTVDEIQSTLRDPRDGSINYLPRSVGEFTDHFNRISGRLPDEQEVKAYFQYKQLREFEKFLNHRQVFKNYARQEAQVWTLSTPNPLLSTKSIERYATKDVIAAKMSSYPEHSDSILVLRGELGTEGVYDSSKWKATKEGKEAIEAIKNGTATMLRVINPQEYPLENFGNVTQQRVRYILVPDSSKAQGRNLNWNDVSPKAYTGPEFDHYVKQANMKYDPTTLNWWYHGDRTIGAFNIRAMGKDIADKLNAFRIALKEGNEDLARELNPLPLDYQVVKGWFYPQLTFEGLTIPSKLSLNDEIRLVPRNMRLNQLDNSLVNKYGKDTFKDGTKETFDQPIDHTPLYKAEPVKFVSPITTVNRSLKKAVESTYMNDYKIFSVEKWIEEAKTFLNASEKELKEAPFYYFSNPTWKAGSDPTNDLTKINNLKTARFQIQQFMGIEDQTQTFLHSQAQRITDSIYNKAGATSYVLAPSHLLPKLRDPFAFMRAVTFHDKMGFFALPQLLVQMNTFSAIYGIAGFKHAAPGTKAMMLDVYAAINRHPNIDNHLDRLASSHVIPGTARFKPGEYLEARRLGEETGFFEVAGEHLLLDAPTHYDIFSSKGKTFLDAGTVFFRNGEKAVRRGAWYTAYLEHRAKNPTGPISDLDRAAILNRADTLSVNMSRASASALHKGVFSIPTQFLSYALRNAELFWGKRLTTTEKARWFAVNAALYGVPMATGIAGIPFQDYMNSTVREQTGYIPGERWYSTAFMEGGISSLLSALTGNDYNVAERYGNQGITFIRDAMKSDQTVLSMITGASGSTLYNTVAAMDPYWMAISTMTKQEGAFKLKFDHLVKPFKEISSVNSMDRFITAMNTGKWVTKNGENLGDVSTANALFMTMAGLSTQDSSELHIQGYTRKAEKELMDSRFKDAVREFQKGLRSSENPDQAADYFRNAIAYLESAGYPIEDYDKFFAVAGKDYESIVDKMNWDYFNEKVPMYRRDQAFDMFVRKLQLQQGKQK